jgi:hypothetical protein
MIEIILIIFTLIQCNIAIELKQTDVLVHLLKSLGKYIMMYLFIVIIIIL